MRMLRLRRCDRILWRGEGMEQLWYVRGESRFSDHRPVNSLFSVQLDDGRGAACTRPPVTVRAAACVGCGSLRHGRPPRVEADEMLLHARTQGGILHSSRF